MFYYYASKLATPLNSLLKKDTLFVLTKEHRKSFKALKIVAYIALVLAFFYLGRLTRAKSNALRNAIGGII